MEQALAQRLREVLTDLPSKDVCVTVTFAKFLLDRRQVKKEAMTKRFGREVIPACART
jgi:hypothetical protein